MDEPKTRFEQVVARIRNNPFVSALVILGTIIITLSTFTDAAKNLWGLVGTETRPEVNGQWQAEVSYDWPNAHYTETFEFSGAGAEVRGTASFLGRKRAIFEGKASQDSIQFSTRTKVALADWDNPVEEVHRYQGQVLGDEIRFIMQTEGGQSEHIAVEFSARRLPNQTLPPALH